MTVDLCIPLLLSVNNAEKPSICAYSSLFVQNYLSNAGGVGISAYAQDYCVNFVEAVTNKITKINNIYTVDSDSQDFTSNCI
jgi:hypothetical protein